MLKCVIMVIQRPPDAGTVIVICTGHPIVSLVIMTDVASSKLSGSVQVYNTGRIRNIWSVM